MNLPRLADRQQAWIVEKRAFIPKRDDRIPDRRSVGVQRTGYGRNSGIANRDGPCVHHITQLHQCACRAGTHGRSVQWGTGRHDNRTPSFPPSGRKSPHLITGVIRLDWFDLEGPVKSNLVSASRMAAERPFSLGRDVLRNICAIDAHDRTDARPGSQADASKSVLVCATPTAFHSTSKAGRSTVSGSAPKSSR
jgi:hypothetical protein